jgi:hypothetical protein
MVSIGRFSPQLPMVFMGGAALQRCAVNRLTTNCRGMLLKGERSAKKKSQIGFKTGILKSKAETAEYAESAETHHHSSAISTPSAVKAFLKKLAKRLHRGRFVVLHVEHGVELSDLQKVMDLLGQVKQLQFAALVADRGVGAH